MNVRTALTAALALDLILAAVVLTLLLRLAPPIPPPSPSKSKAVPLAEAVPDGPAPAEAAPARVLLFDWRVVESEDYRKYIANLRSVGCPEETIRDIITADVNKLFEARKKELRKDKPPFQFWKAGNLMMGLVDPELMQQQQALDKEKRALLKELLGVEPELKPDLLMAGMNPFETMLDFLPADKQAALMEEMQKQQTKMMKLVGAGGSMDAEDMKKMRDAQREADAAIARILSPSEFEDYQLRLSQTAMTMRANLGSFEPTEQEFREIFKLRKPFDDEYTLFLDGSDQAVMQRRGEAENSVKEAIRNVLGEVRYAEYERSQDYNFQQISKLAERQGLDRDSAVKAYDMSRTAQDGLQRVQQDSTLTAEQRQAAFEGIRAETERSMRQVLGEQGYESYRKQPTAYWLRPPPQPAVPSP